MYKALYDDWFSSFDPLYGALLSLSPSLLALAIGICILLYMVVLEIPSIILKYTKMIDKIIFDDAEEDDHSEQEAEQEKAEYESDHEDDDLLEKK